MTTEPHQHDWEFIEDFVSDESSYWKCRTCGEVREGDIRTPPPKEKS